MKLLTFLLFAICISGMYNLRTDLDESKAEVKDLKGLVVLKDDTIKFKTDVIIEFYKDPYWSGMEKDQLD